MSYQEKFKEVKFLVWFGKFCQQKYLKLKNEDTKRAEVYKTIMNDTLEILEKTEIYPNQEKEYSINEVSKML